MQEIFIKMEKKLSNIGGKIKKLRLGLDINQSAFGELVGVSAVAVSNWEKNNREPSLSNLAKMAELGNVSVGWFFEEENEAQKTVTDLKKPVEKPPDVENLEAEISRLRAELKKIEDDLANDDNVPASLFRDLQAKITKLEFENRALEIEKTAFRDALIARSR